MFESISITNFALFEGLRWKDHGPINVIVGRNDTGKTHLLKVMYCLAKSIEEFSKRPTQTPWKDVLANKLLWTFQPEDLSQLIHHGAKRTQVDCKLKGDKYLFGFGTSAQRKIITATMDVTPQRKLNAIFIPPKELLTAFDAIAATREKLVIYGFDDTYYDLIRALRLPSTRGRIEANLQEVLASLEALFGGVIAKSQSSDRFVFERARHSFTMPQTAEGIKKIGILTTLIRNRTLGKGSILFLDEPETNLHPDYIVALMNMLMKLSAAHIQVYLATHSYFVIKQLHILAKQKKQSVVFCSLVREGDTVRADFDDLQNGMPDNPIIEQAVALYRREVALDLKK